MLCYCGVGFIWSKGCEARAQRALLEQSVPTSHFVLLLCAPFAGRCGTLNPQLVVEEKP
jgi:hypothetical protein